MSAGSILNYCRLIFRSMMRNAASRRVPTQEELSDSSQSSARSEQHLLVPIMASMAMLPSMGPFGLVIAGGIVSIVFLNMRVHKFLSE